MIKHPAQKLFHTLPSFVNFDVSTMMLWIVEEWNDIDPSANLVMLQDWGFWKILHKEFIHGLTPFLGLSLSLLCITLPRLAFILPYLCRWLKWSSVGSMKAHSCIISVARSKIGSIEIILIFTS